MDWATVETVLNWLLGKAALLTGMAAVVGAAIAVIGYRKWMPESIGKRKSELAEEILAEFYQAREAIAWARIPGGLGSEGRSRQAAEDEGPDEKSVKDSYYRTIEVLHTEGELFSKLQFKKYWAMAYFGPSAGKPFRDLKVIHIHLVTAATELIRIYRKSGKRPPSRDHWEAIIGWSSEADADQIAKDVDNLIVQVEGLFGPWLMREVPKSWKPY